MNDVSSVRQWRVRGPRWALRLNAAAFQTEGLRRFLTSSALALCVASCLVAPAGAGLYPIAPGPNTNVELQDWKFLQVAPEGLNYVEANAVGRNYEQHPGAFTSGWPPPDSYFVGVFANNVDLLQPDGNLYLWETTGFGDAGIGPLAQLGIWNWSQMTFTPLGVTQAADYHSTQHLTLSDYVVNSSITPLSDFQVDLQQAIDQRYINAVRISYNDWAHNQVTAVASNAVIPEPGTLTLLGLGFVGCAWQTWSRRKRRDRA